MASDFDIYIDVEEIKRRVLGGLYEDFGELETTEIGYERAGQGDSGIEGEIKRITVALDLASRMIYNRAKNYTPVDTGRLRDSLYRAKEDYGYTIAYDDSSFPRDDHGLTYAYYVHEIPYYKHEGITRYKFLEDAAVEVLADYNASRPDTPIYASIEYTPLAVHITMDDKAKMPGAMLIGEKKKKKLETEGRKARARHNKIAKAGYDAVSQEDYNWAVEVDSLFDQIAGYWRNKGISEEGIWAYVGQKADESLRGLSAGEYGEDLSVSDDIAAMRARLMGM